MSAGAYKHAKLRLSLRQMFSHRETFVLVMHAHEALEAGYLKAEVALLPDGETRGLAEALRLQTRPNLALRAM